MYKFVVLLFMLLHFTLLHAQNCLTGVINDYTPVVSFGCDSSTLTVATTTGFHPGDKVLIIQMRGATVDQSNTPGFGTVTEMGTCGNYEFNRISTVSFNEIRLKFRLTRPYDLSGKVQLVRVPEYDNVSICDVTCAAWDGAIGGVLALEVNGTLTLTGKIDASNKGFRGIPHVDANTSVYHLTEYYYPVDPIKAGPKGESIANLPLDKSYGRGRSANSGGGGNAHNAGGGGGGNGGRGGDGGLEYYNTPNQPTPGTNGIGGAAYFQTDWRKVLMGGSGGSGHVNDQVGSSGGNGGGIVLIKAGKLISGSGQIISNGKDVQFWADSNDGQGGGGAGGTILLECEEITGNMVVEAKGGRGGDCKFHVNSQIIGPGGGGGGGRVFYSTIISSINTNVSGGGNGMANQGLTNGALAGETGIIGQGVVLPQDTIPVWSNTSILTNIQAPGCSDPNSGSIEIEQQDAISYSINGGVFQSSPLFANLSPGNYQLSVRLSNGCVIDTSIFIPAPSPISGASIAVSAITCRTNGTLRANPGSGIAPFTYSLDGVNWQSDPLFTNLNAGHYTLMVQDAAGCGGSSTVEIEPYLPLTLQLDSLQQINCVLLEGKIYAKAVGGHPPYIYNNSPNPQTWQSSSVFAGLLPGEYQVTVVDSDTCEAVLQDIEIQSDTASIQVVQPLDLCAEMSVQIGGNVISQAGRYTQTLTRSNGCDSIVLFDVTVLPSNYYIPNIFQPNDDGKNDYFLPFASPFCFSKIKSLQVYDRWGELIIARFELPLNDETLGWDGLYKGRPMPSGVYTYIVEFQRNDDSVFTKTGNVTLVR